MTRKLHNKIQLFDTYKQRLSAPIVEPVKISSRSQAVHLSTQDFGIFSEKVKNCACNIDTIKYIYYKLFSSMCNLCTVLLICNSYLFFIIKSPSFSPSRIRRILYFSSGFPNNWERWYNSGRSGERPAQNWTNERRMKLLLTNIRNNEWKIKFFFLKHEWWQNFCHYKI